jgi:hypothetical protein
VVKLTTQQTIIFFKSLCHLLSIDDLKWVVAFNFCYLVFIVVLQNLHLLLPPPLVPIWCYYCQITHNSQLLLLQSHHPACISSFLKPTINQWLEWQKTNGLPNEVQDGGHGGYKQARIKKRTQRHR